MAYTNLFRKLANAWGIKTEANTEYGALEAIAENPPFGTKTEMVEILPEQSFTDNYDNEEESFYGGTYDYFLLNVESGTEYTFIINGNKYSNKFIADGDTRACEIYENGHPIVYMDNNGGLNVDWAKELGKTITLAIYEEQEVVTPIDIKYLPIEELKKALGLE